MTRESIRKIINEIYSKGPKKTYNTNKSDVHHIDDIWSLDTLDLKDYGSENNRGYRYVLVVIDNFSKFVWTVPLKNNAHKVIVSFEYILISSKRKPNLIETDRGKYFFNSIFQNFLKTSNVSPILEKAHLVLFFPNALTVVLEIWLKNQFLKKAIAIGLIFHLQ